MVQYLVKEVNQFPSDIECMRYIATIADKVWTEISFWNKQVKFIACKFEFWCECFSDFLSCIQELLKKCHQCMETIVKAKDQQAAEANKNASILLKELDIEKVCLDVDLDRALGLI